MSGARQFGMSVEDEVAGAANLLAHPFGGAAALAAIGFGMAGQAMGFWMGSVAGASEMALRLSTLRLGQGTESPSQDGQAATAQVREAIRTMMDQRTDVAEKAAPLQAPAAATVKERKAKASKPSAVAAAIVATQPVAMDRPARPDDLKAISGVGPKLEQVLNGLGIWTYAQVAALTEAEVMWLDGHLGVSGRIVRDDWIGQAAKLSAQ